MQLFSYRHLRRCAYSLLVMLSVSNLSLSGHAFSQAGEQELELNSDATLIQTSSDVTDIVAANEASAQSRESLKRILSELSSYKAGFSQVIIDAQGEVLQESQGVMSLQKPNQLRWEVSFPDESLFVADGNVIYNLDPFVEQVTLLDQAGIVKSNPLMLLISDDAAAWDDVVILSKDDAPTEAEEVFVIQANDANANTQLLTLNFKQGILQSLESVDRQKQVSRIVFLNIQQNLEIAPSAFRVDVPDTYIIDDQR